MSFAIDDLCESPDEVARSLSREVRRLRAHHRFLADLGQVRGAPEGVVAGPLVQEPDQDDEGIS